MRKREYIYWEGEHFIEGRLPYKATAGPLSIRKFFRYALLKQGPHIHYWSYFAQYRFQLRYLSDEKKTTHLLIMLRKPSMAVIPAIMGLLWSTFFIISPISSGKKAASPSTVSTDGPNRELLDNGCRA